MLYVWMYNLYMWNSCLIAFSVRLQCNFFILEFLLDNFRSVWGSSVLLFLVQYDRFQELVICFSQIIQITTNKEANCFVVQLLWWLTSNRDNPMRCFQSYLPLELWPATWICIWLIVFVRTCLTWLNVGKCFHENDKTWMQFY